MLELAVRLVLGAGLVVGAVFAMRWASNRGMAARGGPMMRVVARTGLTKSAIVAVLDVDGHQYLVGVSDENVRLLADLGADGSRDDTAAVTAGPDRTAEDRAVDPFADFTVPDDLAGLLTAEEQTATVTGGPTVTMTTTTPDGSGRPTNEEPRIGLLDRLREMTVRTHLREPIRAQRHLRR